MKRNRPASRRSLVMENGSVSLTMPSADDNAPLHLFDDSRPAHQYRFSTLHQHSRDEKRDL